MKKPQILTLAFLAASIGMFLAFPAQAELRMPQIFSDRMVLQRDLPVQVWGWSDPGDPADGVSR